MGQRTNTGMRNYILIAAGGTVGAITRFAIKDAHWLDAFGGIPWDTLIINVSGSFVLALVLLLALGIKGFDEGARLGISTGFLGAYTTFSTLCKEVTHLLAQGKYVSAVSYVGVSIALGLGAAWLGAVVAGKVLGCFREKEVEAAGEVK